MKTDIVFDNLVVGQKLYSLHWGEVKLTSLNGKENSYYPIVCNITDVNGVVDDVTFAEDGKFSVNHPNPDLFLTNPFEKNQERVIEVTHSGEYWHKRVLIAIKNNLAICWNAVETIEDSKKAKYASSWKLWRELQPEQPTQPKEITLDGVEYVLTPKVK
jgi:hypothetical protein